MFGFFEESFSNVEQGSQHTVSVGYLKGFEAAEQNLVFNVGVELGTASRLKMDLGLAWLMYQILFCACVYRCK